MTLEQIFTGKCKCLLYTSFVILFLGLFPTFIIATTYFRKVHPWLKESDLVGFGYKGSLVCMILSLITLVLIVLMVVSYIFIKCCATNKCSDCFFSFFITILTLGSVVGGCLLAFQTLYNPYSYSIDDDGKIAFYPLCYEDFITGIKYEGLSYAMDNDKLSEFIDWVIDFLFYVTVFKVEKPDKKAFKQKNNKIWTTEIKLADKFSAREEILDLKMLVFIENYTRGQGLMNSKLCGSIGVPIILFCIIAFLGGFFFMCANCCGCCCGQRDTNNYNNKENIQAIQSSSLL